MKRAKTQKRHAEVKRLKEQCSVHKERNIALNAHSIAVEAKLLLSKEEAAALREEAAAALKEVASAKEEVARVTAALDKANAAQTAQSLLANFAPQDFGVPSEGQSTTALPNVPDMSATLALPMNASPMKRAPRKGRGKAAEKLTYP